MQMNLSLKISYACMLINNCLTVSLRGIKDFQPKTMAWITNRTIRSNHAQDMTDHDSNIVSIVTWSTCNTTVLLVRNLFDLRGEKYSFGLF